MAYIAVNENGEGHIFEKVPRKNYKGWWQIDHDSDDPPFISIGILLPKWAIKALTGKDLTWNDDYVELSNERIKNMSEEAINNSLQNLVQYDSKLKKFVYSDILQSFLTDLIDNHISINIDSYDSYIDEYSPASTEYDAYITFKK